jgi:DNA sulfur modification protein DndC
LWENDRLSMERSMALTIESLHAYGPRSRHWAVASSGGKDSTATVTLFAHLLAARQIAPPETLTSQPLTCIEQGRLSARSAGA